MPDQPAAALRLPDGQAWLLPAGARALPAAPLLRPLPGGGALALLDGMAVPALDPAGIAGRDGTRWVALPGPGGLTVLLAAEAILAEAQDSARPLPQAWLAPRSPTAGAARPVPFPGADHTASPPPGQAAQARAASAGLALDLAGQRLVVPAAMVEHISPWTAPTQAPAAPPGVLGYVLANAAPALLLDLGWAAGVGAGGVPVLSAGPVPPASCPASPVGAPPATSLVLLHHTGRRLALPCDRVAAVTEPGAAFAAFLDSPPARAALALAPLVAAPAPAEAQPQRGLLLCRAAGLDFALAVEEVEAVIPPLPPTPIGAGPALRGVCAHRGDILPVVDAGERLGGPPALAAGPVPLLRLAGARPVALAVASVAGLRQVPEADLTPVQADLPGLPPGLTLALARHAGGLLPVLRAAALAAAVAAPILAPAGGDDP